MNNLSKDITEVLAVKKGQVWYPKLGGTPIEILKLASGNGHWLTKKLNKSPKSHKIHKGTLNKFYELRDQ